MEQISSSSSSSSKSTKPSHLNSLHSVRKPLPKPITKKFIAPLPPTPPKVYKVDSSDFKKVVRKLTSSPEFQFPATRRLRDIAPPPLDLPTTPGFKVPPPSAGGIMVSPLTAFTLSPDFCNFLNETLDTSRFVAPNSPVTDYFGALSPLGLRLSPAPEILMRQEMMVENDEKETKFLPDYIPAGGGLLSPLGFSLSPASLSWCSSVFNQSPVL